MKKNKKKGAINCDILIDKFIGICIIKIKFTETDSIVLKYEQCHNSHNRVRRKMQALWLKNQGLPHRKIAQIVGVSNNIVTKYIKEYRTGGIEKLKEINFYRPKSKIFDFKKKIEDQFRKDPPRTYKEAMGAIEKLTGLKRCEKQISKFLKKIDLNPSKIR